MLSVIILRRFLCALLFGVFSIVAVASAENPIENPATIKVITYNVLHHTDTFIDHARSLLLDEPLPSDRIEPTLELLARQQADVIALQEVTPPFYKAIHEAAGLNNYHIESTLPPASTGWQLYIDKLMVFLFGHQPWGQVILSKWPITDVHSYPMGRPLLVANIEIGNFELTVATCHLDSFPDNHKKRTRQLSQAFKIIGPARHAILLGDFNFGDNSLENSKLHSVYIDIWRQLNPDDPGYTYDTKKNTLLAKKVARGKPSRRIDRILVKSTALNPHRAMLIGVNSVMYENTAMHPSDHFGVLVDLRIVSNKTASIEGPL